jgi:hypothetical protein
MEEDEEEQQEEDPGDFIDKIYDTHVDDEADWLSGELKELVEMASKRQGYFNGNKERVWKVIIAHVPQGIFEERAMLFGLRKK